MEGSNTIPCGQACEGQAAFHLGHVLRALGAQRVGSGPSATQPVSGSPLRARFRELCHSLLTSAPHHLQQCTAGDKTSNKANTLLWSGSSPTDISVPALQRHTGRNVHQTCMLSLGSWHRKLKISCLKSYHSPHLPSSSSSIFFHL